jgi:hypothetical protein
MTRTDKELRRALSTDLTVGKYEGGRLLGLGRRATDIAVEQGEIPVIGSAKIQRIPTAWLRQKLALETTEKA